MGLQKVVVFCVLLACGLGVAQVAAKCGECMPNSVQCINETDFYFCQQGRPLISQVNRCAEDEVCTSTNAICVKRDQVVPDTFVCQNECNKCPDLREEYNNVACVSNTEFSLCLNMATTNIVVSCAAGEYCNAELYKKTGKICGPPCVLSYYSFGPTCSNDNYTSTTTVAPTVATQAPNPERLRQLCTNGRPSTQTRYYYVANSDDLTCISYLYCEVINNSIDYVVLTCRTGFFDASVNRCTSARPASCMPTTVTTLTTTTTQAPSIEGNPPRGIEE